MTTINNSQTTTIWTAPKLGKSFAIKNNISRLKSAAARFWENYRTAIEEGNFNVPMP